MLKTVFAAGCSRHNRIFSDTHYKDKTTWAQSLQKTTAPAHAMHTVKIYIAGLPAFCETDAIYLAGDFNAWNAQDENFRLQKDAGGIFSIAIPMVDTASYAFKFTRGSWRTTETDCEGNYLPNRIINIEADSIFNFTIAGWKDHGSHNRIPSTASPQVHIFDAAFKMPQLGRTRRIWVYLPKGYTGSLKKYPVLYMHDGQNLFDDATAFAGEWGVDETMDALKNACIVVGIDNGGIQRMAEYNPNSTKQFGPGEGRAYLAFVVTTLKPAIDKQYRTRAGRQHTYMAGSSMGGLISLYAGLFYPEVFAVLGIFSPSFWVKPGIMAQVKKLANETHHGTQKYFFYAGGQEAAGMLTDVQAVAAAIQKAANPEMTVLVNPAAKHNEAAWGAAFREFYAWIGNR
ncbi:MAG: alpha/beta hydrolase-fold protein [Chitinophagaceae bacterium]